MKHKAKADEKQKIKKKNGKQQTNRKETKRKHQRTRKTLNQVEENGGKHS